MSCLGGALLSLLKSGLLSLSVFFTYMYMNNLTSTHNNLPLTQLSEPLFSTMVMPSAVGKCTPTTSESMTTTYTKYNHVVETFLRLSSRTWLPLLQGRVLTKPTA
jgi:hypothetical protein